MLLKTPPSIFSDVSRDSNGFSIESTELILLIHRENRMYPSSESTALCSMEIPSFQGTACFWPSSFLLFQCQEHLSLVVDGLRRWVHRMKDLGEECPLKHQGLVLCNFCLWTLVWSFWGPDSAVPAALNCLTSAGFGHIPSALPMSKAKQLQGGRVGCGWAVSWPLWSRSLAPVFSKVVIWGSI